MENIIMKNIDSIETITAASNSNDWNPKTNDWNPEIIVESRKQLLKYVMLRGKTMRPPQREDELLIIITGQLMLETDDGIAVFNPGEFLLVPKAIEHTMIAFDEVLVMAYTMYPHAENSRV